MCSAAPKCPLSVALAVLGQETRMGPDNSHLPDSGAKLQTKPCLFISLPDSEIGDQASLLALIP